jgi:hypothetical protein
MKNTCNNAEGSQNPEKTAHVGRGQEAKWEIPINNLRRYP